MKIELGRNYRTRDGREVRIYAVDGGGTRPVHGAVLMGDSWRQERWTINGDWAPEDMTATSYDLIEIKHRIKWKLWVNVYPCGTVNIWYTREDADDNATSNRIACVEIDIDVEEGHGLYKDYGAYDSEPIRALDRLLEKVYR